MVENIFLSSNDSFKNVCIVDRSISLSFKDTVFITLNQKLLSLASFNTIPILWIKSFLDSAAWDSS